MKRRLFQIMEGAPWAPNFAGGSSEQQEGTIYRFLISLSLVFCITSPTQVEGGVSNPWAKSSMWGYWQDIRHANSLSAYLVEHHPAGPTMYHDFYEAKTNPDIALLVRLVVRAHLNNIMPNIQNSIKFPEYREKYLRNALGEIQYILGRLVNHPKALSLSAMVGNLMGRPKLPIPFYQRALSMYPKRAMTQAQFGNFLVGLGEFEDGITRLKVAIELDPKLAVSYGWLAWAYEKNGNSRLAEEYTKNAKEKGFKGKLPKRSFEE